MSSLAEMKKRPMKNNSMRKSLRKNWMTNWAVVLNLIISLNQQLKLGKKQLRNAQNVVVFKELQLRLYFPMAQSFGPYLRT